MHHSFVTADLEVWFPKSVIFNLYDRSRFTDDSSSVLNFAQVLFMGCWRLERR